MDVFTVYTTPKKHCAKWKKFSHQRPYNSLALYHDPFYIFAQFSPAPHRIRNWKSGTKLSFTKAFQKAVNTLQFSLQHSLFSLLLAKMSEMYLLANRGNESTEQSAKHIFTGCYDAFVILRLNIFKDNRQRDAAQSTESTLSRLG